MLFFQCLLLCLIGQGLPHPPAPPQWISELSTVSTKVRLLLYLRCKQNKSVPRNEILKLFSGTIILKNWLSYARGRCIEEKHFVSSEEFPPEIKMRGQKSQKTDLAQARLLHWLVSWFRKKESREAVEKRSMDMRVLGSFSFCSWNAGLRNWKLWTFQIS